MRPFYFSSILLLLLLFTACYATQSTVESQSPSVKPNIGLLDRIQNYPGIYTRGQGENAQVFLRGISSINNPNEVLFIVNGAQVGNFSRAAFMINPMAIKSIQVLKNPTDIAIYGFVGSGGVILVETE
ncbi:MAG: TonB-dependent receptor plug domain-containing protein [Flavobacteriaceae bacterium]